jgi:hypothetical protein
VAKDRLQAAASPGAFDGEASTLVITACLQTQLSAAGK